MGFLWVREVVRPKNLVKVASAPRQVIVLRKVFCRTAAREQRQKMCIVEIWNVIVGLTSTMYGTFDSVASVVEYNAGSVSTLTGFGNSRRVTYMITGRFFMIIVPTS